MGAHPILAQYFNNMKTESRVAQTILQQPKQITVGDHTFSVAPPSLATLIMVSELTSMIGYRPMNKEDYISEVLREAKKCRVIGDILAVLILGAKTIHDEQRRDKKWRIRRRKNVSEEIIQRVMYDLTPKDVQELLITLLSDMDIAFFFGIITSLQEVNLLKPTKTETHPSGQ
jgi:hypothetical protein